MHVLVLLAFLATILLLEDPAGQELAPVLAVAGYLGITGALAAMNTRLSLGGLRGGDVSGRLLRRHDRLEKLVKIWLVLQSGYARWVAWDLGLYRWPLAGVLAGVLPFVLALELSWVFEHPFHRAIRRRIARRQLAAGRPPATVWTLPQFLVFNTRHSLGFIAVPICLIILGRDLLDLYGAPALAEVFAPRLAAGLVNIGMIAISLGVFLAAPLLMRYVWRTARMPESPLRRRLEQMCTALKLRYREILVWRSGGAIANAGVMGLSGRVRYVLLSDALIHNMTEPEIEAIFAHEAGHIREHHIFYALLFVIASIGLVPAVVIVLGLLTPLGAEVTNTLGVVALVALWALGFGWVSRRFERQSDVIGAWTAGGSQPDGRITPEGAAIFAQALQRVAELNGVPQRRRDWRHGSIARRVEHILWLGTIGGARDHIDRLVRRIKLTLWLAATASVVFTVWVEARYVL